MKLKAGVFAGLISMVGFFAVISQFYVAVHNSPFDNPLLVLPGFLSFFTILTNLLTATFFACFLLQKSTSLGRWAHKPGTLSAITGYILVVGLVYQVALRHLWQPTGFAMVVDELLHTIIPALTLVFWYLFEEKNNLKFRQIATWMLYPLAYIIYTFIRGLLTNKYPYPFVDVLALGYPAVLLNTLYIILLFILLYIVLITVGKRLIKTDKSLV
jgi:hypothetical protein